MATNNATNTSNPITVAQGGSGLATLTAHAVQIGNGTGNITQLAVGTSGQILVGSTGADPSFITPTATAGGNLAVTANATTHSYGISAPVTIGNGGTNATSMSTSTGIVKYDGTSLVTSSAAKIDSSNRYVNASQPCFSAVLSSNKTNATGNGTVYTVICDTSLYDQNSNYNTGTGTLTSPLTGKWLLRWSAQLGNTTVSVGANISIVTTARTYVVTNTRGASSSNVGAEICVIADMAANDTATFTITGQGEAGATNTVLGNNTTGQTFVSGFFLG